MKTEDPMKSSELFGTVPLSQNDICNDDQTKPVYSQSKSGVSPTFVKIGAAGVGGLAIGAVAMTLVSGREADDEVNEITFDENAEVVNPETIVPDGEVEFAQGVNDEMSFAEAFEAAREEVGAGGAFVWHGEVYGTYTEAEWNGMSKDEQSEWASHFTWNQNDNEADNPQDGDVRGSEQAQPAVVEQEQPTVVEQTQPAVVVPEQPTVVEQEQPTAVEQEQPAAVEQAQPTVVAPESVTEPVDTVSDDTVQTINMDDFVGLESISDESGEYVIGLVDGHQAVAADVDSDGYIDAVAVDMNDNDCLDDNELLLPLDTTALDDLI